MIDDYGNHVRNRELYAFRGRQDSFVKFELVIFDGHMIILKPLYR